MPPLLRPGEPPEIAEGEPAKPDAGAEAAEAAAPPFLEPFRGPAPVFPPTREAPAEPAAGDGDRELAAPPVGEEVPAAAGGDGAKPSATAAGDELEKAAEEEAGAARSAPAAAGEAEAEAEVGAEAEEIEKIGEAEEVPAEKGEVEAGLGPVPASFAPPVPPLALPPLPSREAAARTGGDAAPSLAPAAAAAEWDVDSLVDALFDSEVSEINVEVGRTPLLRTAGAWKPAGDRELGGADWAAFWRAFCARTGTDPASSGYVTRLVDGSVTVEALLPPVAVEPSFMARRRPPALTLDGMLAQGLVDTPGLAEVRDAIVAHAGILVAGEPREGLTAVLEALVDALPPGERVALVELRPQVRVKVPSVLRMRSPEGQGEQAVTVAMTTSPEWMVIDDALPEAAGVAAWRHGAGGPAAIVAARTADASGWRERAAGTITGLAGGPGEARGAVRNAFPVTVQVSPAEGGFRVRSVDRV